MSDSSSSWYVAGEGKQPVGPFTAEQIIESCRLGKLSDKTPCWREGMTQWVPLAQVEPFASAMSEKFDPYHEWLGIPASEQPPHQYRLLAITAFEQNPKVIENAADRQMAHLRTFQAGKHAAESQRLLNEMAAARICLLNPAKKAQYDARLRSRLAAAEPKAAPPSQEPLAENPVLDFLAPEQNAATTRREPAVGRVQAPGEVESTVNAKRWLIAGGVALLLVAIIWAIIRSGNRGTGETDPGEKIVSKTAAKARAASGKTSAKTKADEQSDEDKKGTEKTGDKAPDGRAKAFDRAADKAGDKAAEKAGDNEKPITSAKLEATCCKDAVVVSVKAAKVGYAKFDKSKNPAIKDVAARYLILTLQIENTNQERKLEYSSWNISASALGRPVMTDSHDNSYRFRQFPPGTVEGQLEKESLMAGNKPLQDVFLFEEPVRARDTILHIELPTQALGESGMVDLNIPIARITIEKEDPEIERHAKAAAAAAAREAATKNARGQER